MPLRASLGFLHPKALRLSARGRTRQVALVWDCLCRAGAHQASDRTRVRSRQGSVGGQGGKEEAKPLKELRTHVGML